MLQTSNKIFSNLSGQKKYDIISSKQRGDWDNTKDFIIRGREWIIDEIKKSGLRGRSGAGSSPGCHRDSY